MVLNKKAVEALPFRYIIIALVAALVVAIALNFVGVLKAGTIGAAEQLNKSTSESVTCSLDKDKPAITNHTIVCSKTTNTTTVTLELTDACGVDEESIGFYTSQTGNIWTDLTLSSGSKTSGTWSGSITNTTFNGASTISVTVSIKDLAGNVNQRTETYSANCS